MDTSTRFKLSEAEQAFADDYDTQNLIMNLENKKDFQVSVSVGNNQRNLGGCKTNKNLHISSTKNQ